ncbi:MAG: aldo/keto reductase [Proteobacteria bacterium]|nr:aldo/keto reductase [Pseudomonadota bacterium]MDA1058906.1 aldo/keto reductase [Pseudomonadota bacterium]
MEHRKLGPSGLSVSLVGLGCNNFGGRIGVDETRAVVDQAIERGINFFDTADVYGNRGGSEDCLGQVLGARRKNIILATKFAMPMSDDGTRRGASRAYIMKACEASLKRLKTDWIDLYQVHQPDDTTPIAETLEALDDLVQQGKVRHIGCSNFSESQLDDAQDTATGNGWPGFVSCQDHYSLLARDIDETLMPAIGRRGLGLLPFFPLASGFLTGKYSRDNPPPAGTRMANMPAMAKRYLTDHNWDIVEGLAAFAKKHNRSLLELAFAWLAARPNVSSVIAGATHPDQIDQNAAAVGWSLSAADMIEIDRITSAV